MREKMAKGRSRSDHWPFVGDVKPAHSESEIAGMARKVVDELGADVAEKGGVVVKNRGLLRRADIEIKWADGNIAFQRVNGAAAIRTNWDELLMSGMESLLRTGLPNSIKF